MERRDISSSWRVLMSSRVIAKEREMSYTATLLPPVGRRGEVVAAVPVTVGSVVS